MSHMCILSVMYVTLYMSGHKQLSMACYWREKKANFSCCYIYIYITDYGYPSQIVIQSGIRMKEDISENKFKA